EAVCAECGGTFPIPDMIPHGSIRVCARCKPIFMQKLAEGAQLHTGVMNYAGFWIRFGAVFLDGILLWVVNVAIAMAAGLGFTQAVGASPRSSTQVGLQLVLVCLQVAIGLSYEVIMIGKYGATLGKMACKIQVVTAEGGKVSYLRALGRYFAKLLSYFTCTIGFIMAGFDQEKRALHDRICSTRVVLK
ncbi:MAG TPA: RDD family protein, partial [Candidatus Sulfotelmatobacter sp.]|nr:RDD family protein [Candidatus Sulfotelmatobacter sp.]